MLDAIYLIATVAVFALLGLLARGVERTDPSSASPAPSVPAKARR